MTEVRETGLPVRSKTTKLATPPFKGAIGPTEASQPAAQPAVRDGVLTADPRGTIAQAATADLPPVDTIQPFEAVEGKRPPGLADEGLFEPLGDQVMSSVARGRALFRALPHRATPRQFVMAVLVRDHRLLGVIDGFKQAYDKLTPEQKARYDAMARTVASDPEARAALASLLISGALFSKDLKGGKTLLDNLQALATGPVADGVDRQQLLSDVLGDVADTSRIGQGRWNACAAATAQRLLAGQSPAEYVRIMAGLASPEGKVTLASGETLTRAADWNESNGDERDSAARLFQASTMEYAARKNGETYDNGRDRRTKKNGHQVEGLSAAEVVLLFDGVLGSDYQKFAVKDIGIEGVYAKVKDAVGKGAKVPCAITLPDGNHHEVLVTRIENGQVSYFDPKDGKTRTVSEADFKMDLYNANIPGDTVLALRTASRTAFGAIRSFVPARSSFFQASDTAPRAESATAPARSGFFGAIRRVLQLIGATDEEIGDGSGRGTQTTGTSSRATASSTSGARGRGRGGIFG